MCGIVGIASSAAIRDRSVLESMRDTLQHRGPDDAGEWWDSSGKVGFGFRRLAIVDLSQCGHQPMTSESGKLQIVFNGEIYNFRELRTELVGLGYTFRSGTDTEVILASYERWGTRCVNRFRGMFAFAIHDSSTNRIFFARDRVGEKPLYLADWGGHLLFASELKALLRHPAANRKIDPRALEWYLAYGYVPGSLCILQDTVKLRPGHCAMFDVSSGKLETWAYWSLPSAADTTDKSEDELVDEFASLLTDAVSEQLLADVPVAVLLSGGMDSSLVTAAAVRASRGPVHTFTVSFPGHGRFDESGHARLLANHYGTVHTEMPMEPATVDLLPDMARQFDEPMADSSLVPTFLLSRLVRKQATVALGGDGGDELFGGYPHYSMLLQRELVQRMVPIAGRRLVAAVGRALPVGFTARNHIANFDAGPEGGIAAVNQYFDAAGRRELLRVSCLGEPPEAQKSAMALGTNGVLQQATRIDFATYLADDILVKVDRASMLTSLEVRAPFLDHRIVEFAFGRVPDRLRATPKGRKVLLRRLASRMLPPDFDVTRKQGFSIPLAEWFRGPWGETMREVLTDSSSIFNRNAIDNLIAGQQRGRNNTHRLFALTLFELWRREYGVQLPEAQASRM